MTRRTRRRVGAGFKDFVNKAGAWLKKTQILSKVGSALAPMAGAYSPLATEAVKTLAMKGYGRRRMRRGGALRPAGAYRGGALNPVGGARMVGSKNKMSALLIPKSLNRRLPMFY